MALFFSQCDTSMSTDTTLESKKNLLRIKDVKRVAVHRAVKKKTQTGQCRLFVTGPLRTLVGVLNVICGPRADAALAHARPNESPKRRRTHAQAVALGVNAAIGSRRCPIFNFFFIWPLVCVSRCTVRSFPGAVWLPPTRDGLGGPAIPSKAHRWD